MQMKTSARCLARIAEMTITPIPPLTSTTHSSVIKTHFHAPDFSAQDIDNSPDSSDSFAPSARGGAKMCRVPDRYDGRLAQIGIGTARRMSWMIVAERTVASWPKSLRFRQSGAPHWRQNAPDDLNHIRIAGMVAA